MSTKKQWQELFRIARVIHQSKPTREGRLALCRLPKMAYRALLCVEHRDDIDYRMTGTPKDRLEQNKIAKSIIDEILAERNSPHIQDIGHYGD